MEANSNAESYQNYQTGAVSNQLTSLEGKEGLTEGRYWGTVNLLMCDRRGALYSVPTGTH